MANHHNLKCIISVNDETILLNVNYKEENHSLATLPVKNKFLLLLVKS